MLELNTSTGLLKPVRYVMSPNYNERPKGREINLLVIHGISLPPGEWGTLHIDALFTNTLNVLAHASFAALADLKVSAHVLIDRAGQITQYVPFTQRAWHAGQSFFGEQENCNDFSIGIELEGTDTVPYTEAQYQRLIAVTQLIQQHYPLITKDHIVGHSAIAPGRKTDPGSAFDWDKYKGNI
jgi:AmpD protein